MSTDIICPDCGEELTFQEGCLFCVYCGFSNCDYSPLEHMHKSSYRFKILYHLRL